MAVPPDEMSCPVLGRLVALLESRRDDVAYHGASTFQQRLAEIERDALMLDVSPATQTLVQVARAATRFAERIARPVARA